MDVGICQLYFLMQLSKIVNYLKSQGYFM